MEKENYKSWNINPDDFFKCKTKKEEILFLLNFAILAPSSHNSQPWLFSIEESLISVYVNSNKKLKVGDKENRLLFISLGCVIKNILVAADFFGFTFSVNYFPDVRDSDIVATILLDKTRTKIVNNEHIIFSILKRSVNRNKYTNEIPPSILFKKITSFDIPEKIKVNVITDKLVKDRISDLVVDSSVLLMEDKNFRAELQPYVKNNFTKSKTGIPAFGMGIPGFISFFIPILIKYINLDKLSRSSNLNLLKNFTPVFLIISTKNDTKVDWIKSGELYQEIALLCENYGIKTSILGAPVLIENCYKSIQAELHTDFRPQVFLRMGYPIKKYFRHSPRLSVSDVLKF